MLEEGLNCTRPKNSSFFLQLPNRKPLNKISPRFLESTKLSQMLTNEIPPLRDKATMDKQVVGSFHVAKTFRFEEKERGLDDLFKHV